MIRPLFVCCPAPDDVALGDGDVIVADAAVEEVGVEDEVRASLVLVLIECENGKLFDCDDCVGEALASELGEDDIVDECEAPDVLAVASRDEKMLVILLIPAGLGVLQPSHDEAPE